MLSWSMRPLGAALSVALVCSAFDAQAQYQNSFGLSATYVEQTGTVSPTEDIDIVIRVSLAKNATRPFVLDLTNAPASYVAPSGVVPPTGVYISQYGIPEVVYFSRYQSLEVTSVFWDCIRRPSEGCIFSQYDKVIVDIPPVISLNPGEFLDIKVLTLTPKNGLAATGTYTASFTSLNVKAIGLDTQGRGISESWGFVQLPYPTDYVFSRTVSAVPEPQTVALLLAGLTVVGLMRRKAA